MVRFGRGLFWYYLEEGLVPTVQPEGPYPVATMTRRELKSAPIRVLYYENRLSVEFFHSLTDGTGGLVFVKTLAAAYVDRRYGVSIPFEKGILDPSEEPRKEELEDAFLRYAKKGKQRKYSPSFSLKGTPEKDDFLHVTCGSIPTEEICRVAKEKHVTVTTLLSAALVYCIARIQSQKVAKEKGKAVRVQIPVNLRKHFPNETLRNFVAVFDVGLEKGEGDFSFEEILSRIHHQMGLYNTPHHLCGVFSANVESEKSIAIRLVPLFLKNLVMRAVFDRIGEVSACLCLSNLGDVRVPEEMTPLVTRFDFTIGTQAKAPYNCAVCSYGGTLRIHLVRNTVEPELERQLFSFLSSLGLSVLIETNER
jgi:NRPS condensation-like uncharacterized protein